MSGLQRPGSSPQPSRAERRRSERQQRRAQALRSWLIDPAVTDEQWRDIRARVAAAVTNRLFEFKTGETVAEVFERELPELFAYVAELGFVLSFDVAGMTPQALVLGTVLFSVKRRPLN